MQLSLAKLPWYGQVGTFVAMAVGAIVAFEFYYAAPIRAELAGRSSQLTALRADITKGLTTAKQLPAFEKEVNDLEARLDNLKAVLPEEKDAADLLRRMQTVAQQSSLTIKSFKPSPVVTKQLHAEWPITLELEGSYQTSPPSSIASAVRAHRQHHRRRREGQDRPTDPNATITATCVATRHLVLLERPGAGAAAPKKAA